MLWLVETHADDVYLSLGWHIATVWKELRQRGQLGILTVYANERRSQEARAYAEVMGCRYRCLGHKETGSMRDKPPPLAPFPRAVSSQYIFPLGLDHEEHRAVANLARGGDWRYVDSPCCLKLKVGCELRQKVVGKEVVSILAVSKRKWKHLDLFKSQSRFFHYNPPETLPRLEIIVR